MRYDDGLSGAMRRVEVIKVDDADGVQKVTVMGLADEVFELPYRGQLHGLTGVPKVGALGYMLLAQGRPDQAFLLGLEHPNDRPKDRATGETVLYASPGQRVEMDDDGNTIIKSAPGAIVHVNPP